MTIAQTQDLIMSINADLDGHTGTLYSININNTEASVTVDWATFKSLFGLQTAERTGKVWSKTIGQTTYSAKDTTGSVSETVPA